LIKNFKEKTPKISQNSYVSESALIIGDVILDEGVSVWSFAVLRGDLNYIHIGAFTNIQESVTIHVDEGFPVEVGENVVVGHNAVLHGCKVGSNSLIGIGAIILDGAEIGEECIIGAGALVSQGKKIPPRSLVLGIPAKVIRSVEEEEIKKIKENVKLYYELSKIYKGR
jgi:carbonic anhydrase/acetyltransferase-like protein (isoleucine patch superfamily)